MIGFDMVIEEYNKDIQKIENDFNKVMRRDWVKDKDVLEDLK